MKDRMDHVDELLREMPAALRKAPPGFAQRVMASLPERPAGAAWTRWLAWPRDGGWLLPALSGVAAALLCVGWFWWSGAGRTEGMTAVHFEIHAPGASQVALVGSFTGWQTDRIVLRGPDASGHWSAEVPLPPGRHEYLFLVDGKQWLADPNAEVRRRDGFGRENALLAL